MVEHLTFNQRVDGSIPSGLTIKPNDFARLGTIRAVRLFGKDLKKSHGKSHISLTRVEFFILFDSTL